MVFRRTKTIKNEVSEIQLKSQKTFKDYVVFILHMEYLFNRMI